MEAVSLAVRRLGRLVLEECLPAPASLGGDWMNIYMVVRGSVNHPNWVVPLESVCSCKHVFLRHHFTILHPFAVA